MNNLKDPISRLNYSGSLETVVNSICKAYDIGTLSNFKVITIGFEDCNVIIETIRGKYVAKLFASWRSPKDIKRYTTTIQTVLDAGVNHPVLIRTNKNDVTHTDGSITLALMDFIEGQSFYNFNKQTASVPTDTELDSILEQAAMINRIDYHPLYSVNSWAVPNIDAMFMRVKKFIKPDELAAIEAVISKYHSIPINRLPHCFVHGDFVKPNLLKGTDGKMYILDFSISNWYPRIHELAVFVANLLYDENSNFALQEKCELVSSKYSLLNQLNDEECRHLPSYALATVAMEFMGAHQEIYINGNRTKETDYLLGLGRKGLRIT